VALSVEPFEEVRKQRAAESLAAEAEISGLDDMVPTTKRRRAVSLCTTAISDRRRGDDDDDDDDDRESVSSDKCELNVCCL